MFIVHTGVGMSRFIVVSMGNTEFVVLFFTYCITDYYSLPTFAQPRIAAWNCMAYFYCPVFIGHLAPRVQFQESKVHHLSCSLLHLEHLTQSQACGEYSVNIWTVNTWIVNAQKMLTEWMNPKTKGRWDTRWNHRCGTRSLVYKGNWMMPVIHIAKMVLHLPKVSFESWLK